VKRKSSHGAALIPDSLSLREAKVCASRTVPKAELDHEKVLVAADHLTRSAEQGYPLFFARGDVAGNPPEQGSGVRSEP